VLEQRKDRILLCQMFVALVVALLDAAAARKKLARISLDAQSMQASEIAAPRVRGSACS